MHFKAKEKRISKLRSEKKKRFITICLSVSGKTFCWEEGKLDKFVWLYTISLCPGWHTVIKHFDKKKANSSD